MSWYWNAYQQVKKTGRKSNYGYNILESTPILHDSDVLETMYGNANHEQKASILLHIDNFSEITHDWEDYQKIANKIWDDYS